MVSPLLTKLHTTSNVLYSAHGVLCDADNILLGFFKTVLDG
jgi:hypothetical protein